MSEGAPEGFKELTILKEEGGRKEETELTLTKVLTARITSSGWVAA